MKLQFHVLFCALALGFLVAQEANAQQCQSFEQSFGDWEICQDYGSNWQKGKIEQRFEALDPSNGFLYGFSGQHGQMLCATGTNPLTGNWFRAGDCTELCFDVNVFADGDGDNTLSSAFKPRIVVRGSGQQAIFNWSNGIDDNNGEGSGWSTVCAPVSKRMTGDPLPESTEGNWAFAGSEADWNDLFSSVDYVQLKVDSVCRSGKNLEIET